MSLAEAQVGSSLERRRSERSPLALPVTVRGVSLDTKPFQEEAFTLSVSAHGALIALANTVTLGQALFLRNPQTQEEVGAWVTRFGNPRGGLAQVGVELVHPDVDFWFSGARAKPAADGAEKRPEAQIHVLPMPRPDGAAESAAPLIDAPMAISADTLAPIAPPDILLRALEQTLQQAAERVVASAANARLAAAVNQAAEAIENFGHSRIRQFEEVLTQYRQEFVSSARDEFLKRLAADVDQAEDRFRTRAAELLQASADKMHRDFTDKIRGTADQAATQFGEQTAGSSNQLLARLTEQAKASAGDVRSQIDAAAATLTDAHAKIREATTACDSRLGSFHEELDRAKEQEIAQFREHMRSVLTQLLASLGQN
jgi:hypothetical protein